MTTFCTLCVRSVRACANSMRSLALVGFIGFAALAFTSSLTGCEGVSDNLPPAVITTKTAGIVRISTTGMGSKEIEESADALATMLSKSKIPQVVQASGLLQLQAAGLSSNPTMQKMDETMAALREIKAKAIYIVADTEAAGSMTDALTEELPLGAEGVIFLVQTTSTNSQSDIQSMAAKTFGASIIAQHIGRGWYWLKSDPKETLPATSDPALAMQFDQAMNALPSSTISFGMRMSDELRANIDSAMEEDSGPLSMFLSGFSEPMKSLNTISAAIAFGPNPTIRAAMNFANKDAAGNFSTTWSTTTRSIAGMAGAMLSAPNEDGQGGIDPKIFTQMAEALDMKQSDAQLTLTLDDAGWKKLIP